MAINGDAPALSGTAMEPGGEGGVQTPALAEDGAGKPGLNAEPTPAEGLGGAPMQAPTVFEGGDCWWSVPGKVGHANPNPNTTLTVHGLT